MNRIGFTMQVKTELLDEYRRHHEAVWPEMLDALRREQVFHLDGSEP